MGLLVAGLAVGLGVGFGLAPERDAARAAAADPAVQVLQQRVAANEKAIAALQKQLDGAVTRLGKRVDANRNATKTLATRSGIQIEFRDN
jgi:hypothetical protein